MYIHVFLELDNIPLRKIQEQRACECIFAFFAFLLKVVGEGRKGEAKFIVGLNWCAGKNLFQKLQI